MEHFQDLGLQLHLVINFWVFIALVVVAIGLFVMDHFVGSDFDVTGLFATFATIFAVIALVVGVIMLVPFQSKYHHLYRVTGTVTNVSNVLSESGGDLTRTPVITLDTVDRDITIDDPRAVNLKGKTVELSCSIAWNYQAADKYSCQIYTIK